MAKQHAIVIGGSMAGLCAARVLSGFYDKVTVIDRDAYPAGAHERPGVPQSRHVHALLARGRIELDRLFTGFEKTMLERGAIEINFGSDFATLRPTGWAVRRPNLITTLFASRVLIEATIRELIRRLSNVELIERADAIGFETKRSDSLGVTGVKVSPRDSGAPFTLTGDLIVDASGRSTKCPAWIEAMGLPMPAETVVAMVQSESGEPAERLVVEGNLDRSECREFFYRGRDVSGRRRSDDRHDGGNRRPLSAER